MKFSIFIFLSLLGTFSAGAQELYVWTEPASNMPSKSIGIRLNQFYMPQYHNSESQIHRSGPMFRLNPELMWGINKNWMMHANLYASNMHSTTFRPEGGGLYIKYRFLSLDEVHSHFRMAAYAKGSIINNPIEYNEINLAGDNSGFTGGIVVTQLLHKLALSFTGGYIRGINNTNDDYNSGQPRNSFNYSLSAGLLTLPIHYKNFKQPNLNLYAEFLGKYNPETKEQFLDLATSVQVILASRFRIDISYRRQLSGNMFRINNQEFLLRLEYNIFSAYK